MTELTLPLEFKETKCSKSKLDSAKRYYQKNQERIRQYSRDYWKAQRNSPDRKISTISGLKLGEIYKSPQGRMFKGVLKDGKVVALRIPQFTKEELLRRQRPARRRLALKRREKDYANARRKYWENVELSRAKSRMYAARDRAKKLKERKYTEEERRAARRETGRKCRKTEKGRAAHRRSRNKKWRVNPKFNLALTMRNRLNAELRKRGTQKTFSVLKYLGCTMEDFIKYIESKFTQGMNWENRGVFGWHLDHIRPCASFDFTREEDREKCFHYSNLQPLWWNENREKSAKWN